MAAAAVASSSSKSDLRQTLGLLSLTVISFGVIVGSGWLLGALTATELAGPTTPVWWVLAGVLIALGTAAVIKPASAR
jgi:amino acid transporter